MRLLNFIFHPRKKSNVYLDEKGYYRFSDSDKLVHRWAAEKKLGRKLRYGEVVHHINRNKRDNSPENLQIFPNQQAHDDQHERDARNYGWKYSMTGRRKKWTLYYLMIGWWERE
jgi:hypothetical protein